ncbi:MAG: hypothetical protein K2N47_01195, partial [Clostridia bacterium]|nr:hypothetical protein [Clostridia bacterium]
MFSLECERGKYLRIRGATNKEEIIKQFRVPVTGELFEGRILVLTSPKRFVYAAVGDTYKSIALREGVDEGKLR